LSSKFIPLGREFFQGVFSEFEDFTQTKLDTTRNESGSGPRPS
jgi:hypothetical protein